MKGARDAEDADPKPSITVEDDQKRSKSMDLHSISHKSTHPADVPKKKSETAFAIADKPAVKAFLLEYAVELEKNDFKADFVRRLRISYEKYEQSHLLLLLLLLKPFSFPTSQTKEAAVAHVRGIETAQRIGVPEPHSRYVCISFL